MAVDVKRALGEGRRGRGVAFAAAVAADRDRRGRELVGGRGADGLVALQGRDDARERGRAGLGRLHDATRARDGRLIHRVGGRGEGRTHEEGGEGDEVQRRHPQGLAEVHR